MKNILIICIVTVNFNLTLLVNVYWHESYNTSWWLCTRLAEYTDLRLSPLQPSVGDHFMAHHATLFIIRTQGFLPYFGL